MRIAVLVAIALTVAGAAYALTTAFSLEPASSRARHERRLLVPGVQLFVPVGHHNAQSWRMVDPSRGRK